MKAKSRFVSNCVAVAMLGCLSPLAEAGSLWREGVTDERGMFSDKRAKRIGDIVTIVIQETAALSNAVRLKTDKAANSSATGLGTDLINQFVGNLSKDVLAKDTKIGREVRRPLPTGAELPTVPTLSANGTNDYTGGGEIRNSQTIASRCAVQIIDTLPNGNLVVEGIREASFSKERQFVSLRGIIRSYDILPDNTVLSSNVADARINVVSEGTLTEAQKKGWLLRINDKINPF